MAVKLIKQINIICQRIDKLHRKKDVKRGDEVLMGHVVLIAIQWQACIGRKDSYSG